MLTTRLAIATAVLLAAAAAPAHADLPDGPKTIKPGKSIGGVSIGMNAEAARARWGRGGSCDEQLDTSCGYSNAAGGELSFGVGRDGKVEIVVIRVATRDDGRPIFKGEITRWKTSKKIRIGSTTKAVRKAYKRVKGSPSGLALVQGKRVTTFATSGGRVSQIYITHRDAGASSAGSKKKKKKKKRKVVSATFTGTAAGGLPVEVKTSRGRTASVKVAPPINCQPRGQSPTRIPSSITGTATRLKGAPYRRGEYYRGPSKVSASMGSWSGQFGGEVQGGKTFVGSVSYQDSTVTCTGEFLQFTLKRTKVRYSR